MYNRRIKRYAQDQKAIHAAMMALLRDRFYEGYRRYMRQGYYPIPDREVMQDIYTQYHSLGRNGVISHLKDELDE